MREIFPLKTTKKKQKTKKKQHSCSPAAIILSCVKGEKHKLEQGQGYHGDGREDCVRPSWVW